MPTERRHDGTMVTWNDHTNICWCTVCNEPFNSVTAFDRHITGPIDDRKHDYSWMPLNSKGYRVTSLKES